jgi:hypothetical protein
MDVLLLMTEFRDCSFWQKPHPPRRANGRQICAARDLLKSCANALTLLLQWARVPRTFPIRALPREESYAASEESSQQDS